MLSKNKVDYRIQRQTSRQWKILLSATVQELFSSTDPAEAKLSMNRIGNAFGHYAALPPCKTLEEFQIAMCSVWQDMDWGRVELEDSGRSLRIIHHGSTNGNLKKAAFGDQSAYWIPSFLEGVYQSWLSSMGAGETLQVRQTSETDEFGSIDFELV